MTNSTKSDIIKEIVLKEDGDGVKKKVTYTRDENLGVEIEGNILETNNAHGASPFDEKPKVTPEERKKIISFAVKLCDLDVWILIIFSI